MFARRQNPRHLTPPIATIEKAQCLHQFQKKLTSPLAFTRTLPSPDTLTLACHDTLVGSLACRTSTHTPWQCLYYQRAEAISQDAWLSRAPALTGLSGIRICRRRRRRANQVKLAWRTGAKLAWGTGEICVETWLLNPVLVLDGIGALKNESLGGEGGSNPSPPTRFQQVALKN